MGPEGYWLGPRRAGYERAMLEAGLEPLPPVAAPGSPYGVDDREGFDRTVRHFLGYLAPLLVGPARPDALLLDTDGHVPPFASACRLMGLEPQKDVWLVGYDNYWREDPIRRFEPTAPLATVDKRLYEVGREMTNLLVERVRGTGVSAGAPPHLRSVPPETLDLFGIEAPTLPPFVGG